MWVTISLFIMQFPSFASYGGRGGEGSVAGRSRIKMAGLTNKDQGSIAVVQADSDDVAGLAKLARVDIATLNLFNFLAPPAAAYEFDRIYSNEQWQKKCNWLRHCVKIGRAHV